MDERAPLERSASFGDLPPDLADVAARYAAQPVPRPTADDTIRLVAMLLAAEPPAPPAAGAGWAWRPGVALRVARWRLRLLGPAFWCAGVIPVVAAGLLTPEALGHGVAMPLILVGPLTAVLGVAYALRTASRGLRDVEASAPISFAEASAGLALALAAFDAALCAAVSAGLALLRLAPFANLMAAWLGPLLLLAGISLPVALRYGARAAALVGGGPWLVLGVCSLAWPQAQVAGLFTPPADGAGVLLRLLAAAVGLALLAEPLARGAAWRPQASEVRA